MSLFRRRPRFSDREIIDGLRSADRRSVTRMEEYLFDTVAKVAMSNRSAVAILPNEADREEALLDAFLALLKAVKAGQFEGRAGAKLQTFFISIFHARCIDRRRRNEAGKNRPHREKGEDYSEHLDGLSDASQNILRSLVARQDLEGIVEILKSEDFRKTSCYEVLLLAAEGYRYREIAEMLDRTEGSVKTTIFNCRARLLEDAAARRLL